MPATRAILLLALVGAAAVGVAAMARSAAPRQQPALSDGRSMEGKVVLVTGSTDGLGREVALRLGAAGANVIVHGRNAARGAAIVAAITGQGRGRARFYQADLASLAAVGQLAENILRDYDRLDVLVNNAGIWISTGERQVSADGHELHFAVNYLSGYVLTRLLLPRLLESAPSRIVNVASGAQSPIDFADVMLARPGRAREGYAQSKLAQIMFTFDLARELEGSAVTVAALHPATMMDTTMVRASGMPAQSSVDEGARAVMNLVEGERIESGAFYDGLRPARAHRQAYDEKARATLRRLSADLTGLDRTP